MSAGLRRGLGTLGGLGRLPKAPGTWASLATALAFAAVFGVGDLWPGLISDVEAPPAVPNAPSPFPLSPRELVALLLALTFVLGWWIGQRAPDDYAAKDPGAFVLDEFVGQGVALLPLLPAAGAPLAPLSPLGLLIAFAAFRVADIAKPPPCRRLESLPGGLGIMADDLMAGAYAAALVWVVGA
ncbi:MAG: phosphatidylglycerophosphatase A family protein [Planctomycetota bacterium]